MSHKTLLRTAAVTAAATLGAMGLWAPASAAPSNVDPDETGSLTVHKYQMPDGGESAPSIGGGEVDPHEDWVALGGVTFSISRVTECAGVPIDLGTTQGWEAIEDISTANVETDCTLVDVATGETSTQTGASFGTITFPDLTVGLYLVQEDGVVAAVDPDGNRVNVTDSALPFLATVPAAGAEPGEWFYDLHAYPKNSTGTALKTCSTDGDEERGIDKAYAVGDSMVWTITGNIPKLAAGDTFTHYLIGDTLPAEVSLTHHFLDVTDAQGQAVAMAEGADYTFDVDDAVAPDGQKITMRLTEAGLAKLDGAQLGSVSLTLDTRIDKNSSDGSIVNGEEGPNSKAYVEINRAHIPVTDECDLGGLHVVKHVAGEQDKVLAGAKFQLFASEADATAKDNPIAFDGETTFVSGEAGEILLDGMVPGTYWLVEIEPPAGYVGYGEPIEVEVVKGTVATAAVTYVENDQRPTGPLGSLGSNATPVLVAGGVLLAGGAVAGGLVRRRSHA